MPPKRASKKAKSTLDTYETITVDNNISFDTLSSDNTSFFTEDSNDTEKAERIL
jgi:hypothetical protein